LFNTPARITLSHLKKPFRRNKHAEWGANEWDWSLYNCHCRMPYKKVIEMLDLVKNECLTPKKKRKKKDYSQRIALQNPPILEKNRIGNVVLPGLLSNISCSMEQWNQILWTDETRVEPGRHTRTWLTHKPDEELDSICIVIQIPCKKRWMF